MAIFINATCRQSFQTRAPCGTGKVGKIEDNASPVSVSWQPKIRFFGMKMRSFKALSVNSSSALYRLLDLG